MDKRRAFNIIDDLFIQPKIADYKQKIFEYTNNTTMREQYENNVKIMEELRIYLKEYLT